MGRLDTHYIEARALRMARSFILLLILLLGGNATPAASEPLSGNAPTPQRDILEGVKSARLRGNAHEARSATRFDQKRCIGFADLELADRPVFTQEEGGEWECSYLLEYPETSHRPSIFVLVRGVQAETWSSFRLKLNFGSVLSRQALATEAAFLVRTIVGQHIHVKELATMLAAQKDFTITLGRIELAYKRERLDETRFNLTGTEAP